MYELKLDIIQEHIENKKGNTIFETDGFVHKSHIDIGDPFLGNFQVQNKATADIVVSDVSMHFIPKVKLLSEFEIDPVVNLNFVFKGGLKSDFEAIGKEIDIYAQHNILYLTNSQGYHLMDVQKDVHAFHISIKEKYFLNIFNEYDDKLKGFTERVKRGESALFSKINGKITPAMISVIAEMKNNGFTGMLGKLFIESKVLELLCLQMDQLKEEPKNRLIKTKKDVQLFEEIRSYIEKNFMKDFTLKNICTEFGTNEFKLKKGFKECFGTTVFDYVLFQRMKMARHLLSSRELNVTQVAEIVGYSHSNHFTTAFKKWYGFTPSTVMK